MKINQAYLDYLELKDRLLLSGKRRDLTWRKIPTQKHEPVASLEIQIQLNKINLDLQEALSAALPISPREEWQHINFYKGQKSPQIPRDHYYGIGRLWFSGKEIRVYKQRGVPDNWAEGVVEGSRNAVNAVGLDLRIMYCGEHSSIEEEINRARDPTSGKINAYDYFGTFPNSLGWILYQEPWRDPSKGGKLHADIVIINPNEHNTSEEYVIPGGLGVGSFSEGYAIVWSNSKRVAMHEVGHLLGVPTNHGESGMMEFAKDYDTNHCVMWWDLRSDRFCDHCLDRLVYFWKGLEKATGQEYFKKTQPPLVSRR